MHQQATAFNIQPGDKRLLKILKIAALQPCYSVPKYPYHFAQSLVILKLYWYNYARKDRTINNSRSDPTHQFCSFSMEYEYRLSV
jgi:hypothetical protein